MGFGILGMCCATYNWCDTVKKSRLWLAERGLAFDFHDFKKQGVPEDGLTQWVNAMGWEPLLNRKGTTLAQAACRCTGQCGGRRVGHGTDAREPQRHQATRGGQRCNRDRGFCA
jgi:hypothetical protein